MHLARKAPRPPCSSLVANGKLLTFRRRRPTRIHTRFHSKRASELQVGTLSSAAGKSTNQQILTTTIGSHRALLPGTRSSRKATLYRHMPTSAATTTDSSTWPRPSCDHGTVVHCPQAEIAAPLRRRRPVGASLQRWPYSFDPPLTLRPSASRLTWRESLARDCGTLGTDRGVNQLANGPFGASLGLESIITSARRALIWSFAPSPDCSGNRLLSDLFS